MTVFNTAECLNQRKILIQRLKKADLPLRRFLKVDPYKAAFEKEWQLNLYTPEELKNYPRWGICGGNGLVQLEADKPEMATILRNILPKTLEVLSPRRELPHFFLKITDGEVPNGVLHIPGDYDEKGRLRGAGEIRTKGQYFVAAGTPIEYKDLKTGELKKGIYKILNDRPIAEMSCKNFIEVIKPFLGDNGENQPITLEQMRNGVPEGTRHAQGIKYANFLIGVQEFDYATALIEMKNWNKKCQPPMNEKDLVRMVKGAIKHQSKPSVQKDYAEKNNQFNNKNNAQSKKQIKKDQDFPVVILNNDYFLAGLKDNAILVKSEQKPSKVYYSTPASCYVKSVCGSRFRKKVVEITGLPEKVVVAKTLELSMLNKDDKEPEQESSDNAQQKTKINTKESAGFYKNGVICEQVEGDKYVFNKNFEEKAVVEIDGVTHTPLNKIPWPLATKPTVYEGIDFLRNSIKDYLKEHLFLADPALYDIMTSWIIATYTPEVWKSVPYLFFYGPIGSGKTRALELLLYLSFRGLLSSNISPSALYRAIEALAPTVLLDETEILSKEAKAEIFGLINSGYRKGQVAIRVKNTQNGSTLEYFIVFGFKAFAGTYSLKKATESRCITIYTIKAGKIKVRRTIDEKRALELRNMLLGYRFYQLADLDVMDVSDVILDIGETLSFVNGRMLELFTPIVAVAGEDKDTIIEYLKKLSENKDSEELASEEAEIVQILSKEGAIDGDNFIPTKDISTEFNSDRIGEDIWNNRRIGWLMRKLGFNSKKIKGVRGWTVQPDRLIKYKEIYTIKETGGTDDPPKETSETPKTSTEENKILGETNEYQTLCDWATPKAEAGNLTYKELLLKINSMGFIEPPEFIAKKLISEGKVRGLIV